MNNKKILGAALATSLVAALSMGTVMAQDPNDPSSDQRVETERDDDGFDWGLLGLLGLLGLIPRKQHTVVHHDTNRTGTTGTPR
jgi:hypothetical protein